MYRVQEVFLYLDQQPWFGGTNSTQKYQIDATQCCGAVHRGMVGHGIRAA